MQYSRCSCAMINPFFCGLLCFLLGMFMLGMVPMYFSASCSDREAALNAKEVKEEKKKRIWSLLSLKVQELLVVVQMEWLLHCTVPCIRYLVLLLCHDGALPKNWKSWKGSRSTSSAGQNNWTSNMHCHYFVMLDVFWMLLLRSRYVDVWGQFFVNSFNSIGHWMIRNTQNNQTVDDLAEDIARN